MLPPLLERYRTNDFAAAGLPLATPISALQSQLRSLLSGGTLTSLELGQQSVARLCPRACWASAMTHTPRWLNRSIARSITKGQVLA